MHWRLFSEKLKQNVSVPDYKLLKFSNCEHWLIFEGDGGGAVATFPEKKGDYLMGLKERVTCLSKLVLYQSLTSQVFVYTELEIQNYLKHWYTCDLQFDIKSLSILVSLIFETLNLLQSSWKMRTRQ